MRFQNLQIIFIKSQFHLKDNFDKCSLLNNRALQMMLFPEREFSSVGRVLPKDSLIVGHHMTHVISIWPNNFAIIVVKHHQTGRFEDLLTFERVQWNSASFTFINCDNWPPVQIWNSRIRRSCKRKSDKKNNKKNEGRCLDFVFKQLILFSLKERWFVSDGPVRCSWRIFLDFRKRFTRPSRRAAESQI